MTEYDPDPTHNVPWGSQTIWLILVFGAILLLPFMVIVALIAAGIARIRNAFRS